MKTKFMLFAFALSICAATAHADERPQSRQRRPPPQQQDNYQDQEIDEDYTEVRRPRAPRYDDDCYDRCGGRPSVLPYQQPLPPGGVCIIRREFNQWGQPIHAVRNLTFGGQLAGWSQVSFNQQEDMILVGNLKMMVVNTGRCGFFQ